MKKIAIYSRKSKFTAKGDSIENQIEMCKAFATKHLEGELEFLIYEDEGFSGGNTDRPQFKQLMKDARNQEFEVLVCYRLDRISRNVADFSILADRLQALKIDFLSIREQFDTSTPMGRAMMYIASVFAQLERETIAERIKDNMLELAKNGNWTGGRVPIGFESVKKEFVDSKGNIKETTLLIIDEKEMEFVKFLYEKYLELGSLHQLEIYTHQNNIKSHSGRIFEKSTMKIILQNPVYVKSSSEVVEYLRRNEWEVFGDYDGIHSLLTYNKTENIVIDGKVSKVLQDRKDRFAAVSKIKGSLEPKLWLDVQRQFDKNRSTFPRLGKTHNVLLTGKIRCGDCDSYMQVIHGRVIKSTGKKRFFYGCSLKKKSKGELCQGKNARADEIEQLVIISLKQLALEKQGYIESLKEKNDYISDDKGREKEKNNLLNDIEIKKTQIDNLVIKLSMDSGIDDLLMDKIKGLKEEIKSLYEKLERIDSFTHDVEMKKLDLSFVSSILDRCALIDEMNVEEQKQIINALIDTIHWYGDEKKMVIRFIGGDDDPDNRDQDKFNIKEYSIDDLEQLSLTLFFNSVRVTSIQQYYILRKFIQCILLTNLKSQFT